MGSSSQAPQNYVGNFMVSCKPSIDDGLVGGLVDGSLSMLPRMMFRWLSDGYIKLMSVLCVYVVCTCL